MRIDNARAPPLPAAVDDRGAKGELRRQGRDRTGARLFLFRRRAAEAVGDKTAHTRRGTAHRGERGEAAGVAPQAEIIRLSRSLFDVRFASQSGLWPT